MGDLRDDQFARKFTPKIWARLAPFLQPLSKRAVFVLLMMLLSALVDAAIPLFTRYAVNAFVVPGTTKGLPRFTLVYIAAILFQALTTVLFSRQSMVIEMQMGRAMKKACFIHLQKLPISFFNTTSVGYLLARVMSDTNRISGIIAWVGATSFWYVIYLAGILVSMFVINAKMAAIVLLIFVLAALVTGFFQSRILEANRDMRRASSRVTSSFNENIIGAKTSKTLVIEDKNSREFQDITRDMYTASMRAARLNAVFIPIVTFVGSMALATALYSSGTQVISGALDFGVLSAFIAYSIALLDPVTQMARFFSELMSAQVNIERVMSLLDQPQTIRDSPEVEEKYGGIFDPKPENWPRVRGDVEFRDVWFRYPDAAKGDYVLKDINLSVPAGTTVAIVGETGAGKSTMVNLACRFFEPSRGEIRIDGVNYKERGQIWLHSNIGYVQQSPHLFSGTVAENILYGKLDATREELDRAAKLSCADRVIARLEQGYETDVGEGGDKLSTGEKQLISFARAVIADPPVFVLDEATSSIDTETERLMQEAISNVLTGRTSFIIAHRLSTIQNADLILLIDQGRIREQGTHEQLMAQGGDYYRLYTAMMIQCRSGEQGFSL